MASVQITPSGIGQTCMIIFAILGVAAVIDSIMFMYNVPTILNYVGINIYFDERVRAAAVIAIGILIFMFGLGLWTVGVGAIALVSLFIMSYGNIWGAQGWKGTTQSRTATTQTQQAQAQQTGNERYRCPLEPEMKEWCTEDYNNNGILNRDENDPNQNCRFQSYVTTPKTSNACKLAQ